MPRTNQWPPEAILSAIHRWMEAHGGRFPDKREFSLANGLPSRWAIEREFRTMANLRAAYHRQYPQAVPQPEPRMPSPRAVPWSPPRRTKRRQADHRQARDAEARAVTDPYHLLVWSLLDEALGVAPQPVPAARRSPH